MEVCGKLATEHGLEMKYVVIVELRLLNKRCFWGFFSAQKDLYVRRKGNRASRGVGEMWPDWVYNAAEKLTMIVKDAG